MQQFHISLIYKLPNVECITLVKTHIFNYIRKAFFFRCEDILTFSFLVMSTFLIKDQNL